MPLDIAVATELCRRLQQDDFIAVLAGGCVRDRLLGREPKDLDIATSATPEEVVETLGKSFNIFPKGMSFGVMSAVVNGCEYEIATLRSDGDYSDGRRPDSVAFVNSLEADAARRDFTINSMFLDPMTGELFDFFGGHEDLQRKLIRCVGSPSARFSEDHLRMLRAVRFAAQLGFTIDFPTVGGIVALAYELKTVSSERIRDEFEKILCSQDPRLGLKMTFWFNMIQQFLPEIVSCVEGPRSYQDRIHHPEGTVWDHTLLVMDELNGSSFELMLGGLLHDIGKPNTQVITDEGRITNHGHAEVGAEIATTICRRLKLSTAQTEHVTTLVAQHMRMHIVDEMSNSKLRRLLENPYYDDLVSLQHADVNGTTLPEAERLRKSQRLFLEQKRAYFATLPEPQRVGADNLITGDILIEHFNLTPGPQFKPILLAAQEAQAEGEFETIEGGIEWLKTQTLF